MITNVLHFRIVGSTRSELSYLAPLGSENFSAPYFKQCFFRGGGITPQTDSNITPPSPKREITNILFFILICGGGPIVPAREDATRVKRRLLFDRVGVSWQILFLLS